MLELREMPCVSGFATPEELYCVALEPAPLFGMPHPMRRPPADWESLFEAGIRGVLCLTGERAHYDPTPVELLAAVELEDLFTGAPPADPGAELALIRRHVDLVLDRLAKHQGVVVHCLAGRGRTSTVLGCVLVRLGEEPQRVIDYFDRLHKARGRTGWPEAEWQAGVVRGATEW
ncbi:MAG: hypothetical protein HS104_06195 [Polyangiaceae bacterium]|nr:hypothetical protein [Polyangiaceae bacterium]MCE7888418.1 hypothetical protein [Sorangiineae bacterium PRO1]MCL4755647.1 hypothetical protein [Myxococcales bacterium]